MKTIKDRPFNFHRSLVALLALAFAPCAGSAATLHGSSNATVIWVSTPDGIPQHGDAEMANREREFIPPYVVIPVGAQVRFPNDDPFYHSIYSDSSPDPFDIGYYGPGPGKLVTFSQPGIIEVHCHIHASMHATIIVADGPFTIVSKKGAYSLANVPQGKHVVHAWDPDHGERTSTVTMPSADADVTLDLR